MTKSFSAKVFENEPGTRRLERSDKKHKSSKPDEFYAGVKIPTPDNRKQSDESSQPTYGVYQDMKAQCRASAKVGGKVLGYNGSDPNYIHKFSAKDFYEMITPDSMAGPQDAESLRKTFKQKKLSSTTFVQ
jgi:hypothetical protein